MGELMKWAYKIIDDDINILKEILLVLNLKFDHFAIIRSFYYSNCNNFAEVFWLLIDGYLVF